MTDLAALDMNVDDVQEARTTPPGGYLAVVSNFKSDKLANEKETPFVDVEFRLQDATDGQDLTGVNLNRPVYARIFMTTDALPLAKKQLKEFGVDISGLSFKEAFEKIVGATVKVQVGFDPYYLKNRQQERPIVKSWAAA
jgi:hypothetical protein